MSTTITLGAAAKLLSIGRSTAYAAVHNDEFPVPVIRIGGRIVVPTKPLLDLLGIDELPNDTDPLANTELPDLDDPKEAA